MTGTVRGLFVKPTKGAKPVSLESVVTGERGLEGDYHTRFASKRQILTAREKNVYAAREKLDGMLGQKRDLEVQLENLDARLKTIQAAQTASNVQLDDSQLGRAKKLIGELNKQLDVAQRMLDADGKFTGLIPVANSFHALQRALE